MEVGGSMRVRHSGASASVRWHTESAYVRRMGVGVGSGLASGVVATQVCAPLLLLCWLCCWPDDSKSDTSSSGKHPKKPIVAQESGSRRRSNELFGRRFASSAVSLHLPSTSGHKKQPLSAHRSHEEIRGRRKSHHETNKQDSHYHSAPSVIDEVLHRRDWERSTKDLYIPLNPESELADSSDVNNSPGKVTNEVISSTSSEDGIKADDHHSGKTCKKHYTNIKSSRNRVDKETTSDEVKDQDATENISNFYIGDPHDKTTVQVTNQQKSDNEDTPTKSKISGDNVKSTKEAKQTLNESIRSKEGSSRPKVLVPVEEHQISKAFDFEVDELDRLDRTGATHHSVESRSSLTTCVSRLGFPSLSVEPVGYEGGACYLAEEGTVSSLRASRGPAGIASSAASEGGGDEWRGLRGRHASDGDILGPAPRPESGAFSESDLDLELEESEERPPAYNEIHQYSASAPKPAPRRITDRKETAI